MAENYQYSTCTGLMTMAERELGAFISAVTQLYGPEEARISAEDWLDELESLDGLPGFKSSEWRQITIAAAARIASRLVGGTSFSGTMQPAVIRSFKSTCTSISGRMPDLQG